MGFSAFSPDDDTPVFVISVAAQLAGMHAQTLRQYDRLGLVTPSRTSGGGRRYSQRDVALLREVQRLSQEEGVSLPGIARILELENQVTALRARVAELGRRAGCRARQHRPRHPGLLGVAERRRVCRPARRAPAARPLHRARRVAPPARADARPASGAHVRRHARRRSARASGAAQRLLRGTRSRAALVSASRAG